MSKVRNATLLNFVPIREKIGVISAFNVCTLNFHISQSARFHINIQLHLFSVPDISKKNGQLALFYRELDTNAFINVMPAGGRGGEVRQGVGI